MEERRNDPEINETNESSISENDQQLNESEREEISKEEEFEEEESDEEAFDEEGLAEEEFDEEDEIYSESELMQIPEKPIGEPYEKVRTDYPIFLQLPNGCGLSSMLMFLDPLQDENLAHFLDEAWKGISQIMMQHNIHQKEFQWSFVLEYLLIKSLADNVIKEYIYEKQPDYDVFSPLLSYDLAGYRQGHMEQKREYIAEEYDNFFRTGIINQFLLTQHIGKMKTNMELKMLFELFGYEFVPYYSDDPTCAVIFTKKEMKNPKDPDVKERLDFLKNEFNKGARIMLGSYHHWVVVSNIILTKKGYEMIINDSNVGKRYNINFRRLSDTDRFYVYKKRNIDIKPLWNAIIKYLENEFVKERDTFEIFKIKLQESIKKRLEERKKEIEEVSEIKQEDLVEIPKSYPTSESQINQSNTNSNEIFDLSSNNENHEPLSGEEFKEYLRKVIRKGFSDYHNI